MGITATRVGMYHSHPKLGVFMSSVDISTNRTGQLSDQHVSIVVDSVESVETGRLEIAAFRRCCALPLHPFPHSNCSTRCSYSIHHPQSCPNPPPAPKEEAVDAFAVDPLEESQGARSHAWFIFFSLATARHLHIAAGNGLGLGGLKLYRLGHQKSASDRENPHSEGLAFYKNGGIASSAGGYYRLKMGICKSATESEASMQVLSVFVTKNFTSSILSFLHIFLPPILMSLWRADAPRVMDHPIASLAFDRLFRSRCEKHRRSCQENCGIILSTRQFRGTQWF